MKYYQCPRILLLALTASPFAMATSFQTELSVQYQDSSANDMASDERHTQLNGIYYFQPVENNKAPLSETAFAS